MDIVRYFDRRSKKRDLCDQTKAERDPKSQREQHANMSCLEVQHHRETQSKKALNLMTVFKF